MPPRNVEVVRQPIAVGTCSRRRLEERLMVRFPWAVSLLARAIWRLFLSLPPRSRLRRAVPRHFGKLGFEALNRRDLAVAFSLYHPDSESIFDQKLVALGFEPLYRGREARIEGQTRWMAEWDEVRFEPDELVDLGDGRLFFAGRLEGSGLSSRAEVDNEAAFIFTLSAGRVIHERVFLDRREGLEAAGLTEPGP
jgi:ketosteroid isomerase-like protein